MGQCDPDRSNLKMLLLAFILVPTLSLGEDAGEQLLSATNEYRNQNGKGPLVADTKLSVNAQMWADELAQRCVCEGKQCHSPVNMKTPGYSGLAENVAMECKNPPKAINAIDGWKKSPGHNKNMLSSLTNVGFGVGEKKYLTHPPCPDMSTN